MDILISFSFENQYDQHTTALSYYINVYAFLRFIKKKNSNSQRATLYVLTL